MLEYTINGSDWGNAYETLPVVSFETNYYSYGLDEDYLITATVKHDSDKEFHAGDEITVTHSYDIYGTTANSPYESRNELTKHNIITADNTLREFSFTYRRYSVVEPEDFFRMADDEGKIWWCFVFPMDFTSGTSVYQTGMLGLRINFPVDTDFKTLETAFEYYTRISVRCEESDLEDALYGISTLDEFIGSVYKWVYVKNDYLTEEEKAMANQVYSIPETASYSDPEFVKITETDGSISYYEKTTFAKNVSELKIQAENVLFSNDDEFTILIPKIGGVIDIPITAKFNAGVDKDDVLEENFVNREVKNSVNSIPEMEKDMYYPVKRTTDSGNGYLFSKKIVFNLHFRHHRGENWLIDDDSTLWNGVYDDNGVYRFMNKTSNQPQTGEANNQYFSYEDFSSQSDLLMFLGFTNSDVRFRKKRISNTFIRLSFYDSMDTDSQNLLAYSTIYLDSGELYKKMAQNSTGGKFIIINEDTSDANNSVKIARNGINTEPDSSINDDLIENYRLSSQFVTESRRIATKSSEGFCLYLWKDYSDGVVPVELYMKVEFYHAKYGRRIPLMAPYRENNGGFKSFQEIVDDWSSPDSGYGIRKYTDYSYIRLKYTYDKNTGKHVYYLDDSFYGDSVKAGDDGNGDIIINLYEAKVRF